MRCTQWTLVGALSPWLVFAGNTPDCIENTNRICSLGNDCLAGETCGSWWSCMCPSGQCATTARTCNESTYQKLDAPYYMISNSRWPDYFMDMGEVTGAGVTGGFPDDDAHKFHIRVPTTLVGGGLSIILTSKKWPDYSLAVQAAVQKNTNIKLVGIEHITDDDVGVIEASVKLVIPPVPRPDPENRGTSTFVMIMGAEHANYFDVATTSWDVSAPPQDEGAGSYWYIHPALPNELVARMQAYSGTPCELNCGEPGAAESPPSMEVSFAGFGIQLASVPVLALLVAAFVSSIM